MNRITEDQLQAQCVEWFRLQYPYKIIFAIPNGGLRNKIVAAKLKRCGVLAGVPDLCIPHIKIRKADGLILSIKKEVTDELIEVVYHGLYIELKVGTNKPRKNQYYLHHLLKSQGYCVKVCYTFEEFVRVVKEYFGSQ